MLTRQTLLAAGLLLVGPVILISCSAKPPGPAVSSNTDSVQYSIRAYARGQIGQLYDQPITLFRIERDGNSYDSALLPIMQLDWKNMLPAFISSDISAPEFTGQYRFSIANDDQTAMQVLTYEALRPDLYTRLFQISTDISDHFVKSIYIETRKSSFWKSTSRKLLYVPGRVVQLQETEDPLVGAVRQRRLEYKFLDAQPDEVPYEE